jgi:hypothetical protein
LRLLAEQLPPSLSSPLKSARRLLGAPSLSPQLESYRLGGDYAVAWNAMVLGITHMIVIQFAFSVVLWLGGFRNVRHFGTWSFLEFLRSNFWNFAALCALAVALGVRCHHVVATALFETEMRSVPQNAPDDFRRSTSMRYASSPARAARWVAQSHGDAIGSASSVRRQPGGTAHSIREGRLCGSRWLITLP